ncbi:hypothetical protein NFI96_010322 [Prochilodus magdalenae]|nr:hypothetical protein NFI96_010322 [Prochilodus magdalenae]
MGFELRSLWFDGCVKVLPNQQQWANGPFLSKFTVFEQASDEHYQTFCCWSQVWFRVLEPIPVLIRQEKPETDCQSIAGLEFYNPLPAVTSVLTTKPVSQAYWAFRALGRGTEGLSFPRSFVRGQCKQIHELRHVKVGCHRAKWKQLLEQAEVWVNFPGPSFKSAYRGPLKGPPKIPESALGGLPDPSRPFTCAFFHPLPPTACYSNIRNRYGVQYINRIITLPGALQRDPSRTLPAAFKFFSGAYFTCKQCPQQNSTSQNGEHMQQNSQSAGIAAGSAAATQHNSPSRAGRSIKGHGHRHLCGTQEAQRRQKPTPTPAWRGRSSVRHFSPLQFIKRDLNLRVPKQLFVSAFPAICQCVTVCDIDSSVCVLHYVMYNASQKNDNLAVKDEAVKTCNLRMATGNVVRSTTGAMLMYMKRLSQKAQILNRRYTTAKKLHIILSLVGQNFASPFHDEWKFYDEQVPVRTGIEPAATPLPTSGSFPVGKPEKFDGAPNLCSGFLLQCSIYFANSPPCSDKSRIAFVVSLLIGKALDWATAVWPSYERGTYEDFIKDFKAVFDHPNEGKTAGDLLFQLHQGSRSVAQYALEFRTVAAGTGWNEPALLTAFRHGLHMDIRKELAYRHDGLTLEELISLAIRLDQLKNGANPAPRKSPVYRAPQLPLTPSPLPPLASRSTPELSAEEPMQVDTSRLSPGERQRRMRRGLCLYCGNPGHILRNCSLRPQRNPLSFTNRQDSTAPPSATPRTSAVSSPAPGMVAKSFMIPVTLYYENFSCVFPALIDSGAEGNFMNIQVVKLLQVPVSTLKRPLRLSAVDGDPVGPGYVTSITSPVTMDISALHSEKLPFFVLETAEYAVILGLSWLKLHDPSISWSNRDIIAWSPYCFKHCLSFPSLVISSTSIESPDQSPVCIPPEYCDLAEVFNKANATKLPPHREYDCAIDLINDQIPPKSRVYPLTQAEDQAMEEYIQEALAQGYIRPSTSPAAAGFFFVKKKDGGLRPCIDYRGLNAITKPFFISTPFSSCGSGAT